MSRARLAALGSALWLGAGCQFASGLDALEVPAKANGQECVVDPECSSGFCTDGVCCNEACDGECVTCRAADHRGACTPHPISTDPDGDCGQFGRCDDDGSCTFEGLHEWSYSFGGEDDQGALGLAYGSDGELVMMGSFNGTIVFDRTLTAAASTSFIPNDLFVATFDGSGQPRASRAEGDDKVQRPTAVGVDGGGNVVLTGVFSGTLDFGGALLQAPPFKQGVFLATLFSDLTTVRARAFVPQHPGFDYTTRVDEPTSVVADDDSVLLAGHYRGGIDFGLGALSSIGDQDYYLVKFDASGAPIWNNGWGSSQTAGESPPYPARLTVGGDDAVVLTGTYRHPMAIGDAQLPSDGEDADQSFVAAIGTSNGQPRWARAIGGRGQQVISTVAPGPDDTLVMAGVFTTELAIDGQLWTASAANHVDFFVTKLDGDGGHIMTRTFPGSPAIGSNGGFLSVPRDLEVDQRGNVVLFGQVHGSVAFGPAPLVSSGRIDVFVAKLTSQLEHLWSKRYGDGADQLAYAGALDAEGNIVTAGIFSGEVDFGGASPLVSAGGNDAFLVKFSP